MACDRTSPSNKDDNKLVTPDHSAVSPSGDFTASVEYGPEENKVKTWVPVIRDKSGNEVFRDGKDEYGPYSTRQTTYVAWLSTKPNELWIYSGDVGVFSVSPDQSGSWTKKSDSNVPQEIKELHPGGARKFPG
ncbi:hypothetical protein DDT46_16775 [Mycobacteroides abscessus]|nr:hypothetical protein DDT46_16775 [Mycobacteroides abscessus]